MLGSVAELDLAGFLCCPVVPCDHHIYHIMDDTFVQAFPNDFLWDLMELILSVDMYSAEFSSFSMKNAQVLMHAQVLPISLRILAMYIDSAHRAANSNNIQKCIA